MEDKRIRRKGVAFQPRASHVREACWRVEHGLPVHKRWLPFLPPRLRAVAVLEPDRQEDMACTTS